MRTAFIIVSSALLATAAFAQPQPQQIAAQPAVATAPASEQDQSKIVCHHQIHEGQLVKLVDCKSQVGWDRVRQRTRDDFATFQYRSMSQRGRN